MMLNEYGIKYWNEEELCIKQYVNISEILINIWIIKKENLIRKCFLKFKNAHPNV